MVIVFVVDGLRPDSIDADDTPTLHRLRAEGVSFEASHAAFPTVTRVNAAVLATGHHPGATGILGNTMYFREVDPARAFSNDDWKNLVRVDQATDGRAVLVPSLAERLQARRLTFAAVGSGSTGSSWLLNPCAARGVGVLVNGYLEPGTLVAHPPAANTEILGRFGAAPAKGARTDAYDASVDWTETVLREYVLPTLAPDVVINWLTEPDHTQHALSVGSPEARASIRNDDRHVGLVLKTLETLGRAEATNVFVVLSIEDYRALAAHRPDFKAHLLGGPKVDDFSIESDILVPNLGHAGFDRDPFAAFVRQHVFTVFLRLAIESFKTRHGNDANAVAELFCRSKRVLQFAPTRKDDQIKFSALFFSDVTAAQRSVATQLWINLVQHWNGLTGEREQRRPIDFLHRRDKCACGLFGIGRANHVNIRN